MENTVRKGEIACNKQFLLFSQCFQTLYGTYFSYAGYHQFLLFLQCFQKAACLKVVKSQDCVVKN